MAEKEQQGKVLEVAGKYLARDLRGMSNRIGRMLMVANYVCDVNDVIARRNEKGEFQIAKEVQNPPDWRLFQELLAQADINITGSAYIKRYLELGENAQNVLDQFSVGGKFEDLGDWREEHKLPRNPDIAIVSRSLDFDIPDTILDGKRKIIVFTTYHAQSTSKARDFKSKRVVVFGCGVDGVDGEKMFEFLAEKMKYRVAKMSTGPSVLKILLDAKVLDELYLTRVNRDIEASPENTQTILGGGKSVADLPGFTATKLLHQDGVETKDEKTVSQDFWVYDSQKFLDGLKK